MVHPYFVAKAREAFAEAGGNPDLSGALAEWAEAARHRQPQPHGVLVAENGELLAETVHVGGAAYVNLALVEAMKGEVDWEVGFVTARAIHVVGQDAVHIKTSRLCYGAGRFIRAV